MDVRTYSSYRVVALPKMCIQTTFMFHKWNGQFSKVGKTHTAVSNSKMGAKFQNCKQGIDLSCPFKF